MNTKSAKTLRNFCRTCMTKFSKIQREIAVNNKQNINDVPIGCKNISLMELLHLVHPQIKVEINDNLPTLVCSNCIKQLLMAHGFIEMYKNADKQYRKMLQQVVAVTNSKRNEEVIGVCDPIEDLLDKENVDDIYELTKLEVEKVNIEELEREVLNVNDWPEFNDEPLDDISMEEECKEYFTNPYIDDEYDAEKDLYYSNIYSDTGDEWTPNDSSKKITRRKLKKISAKKSNSKKIFNNKNQDDGTTTQFTQKKTDCKDNDSPTKITFKKTANKVDEYTTEICSNKNQNDETSKHILPKESDSKDDISKDMDEEKLQSPLENENGSFLCQKCHTVFDNKQLLKEHMRFHQEKSRRRNGEKRFKCEICGKAYTQQPSYKIHMRTHTGEKPYLCIECGKSFKALGSLKIHMLRHKGEKNVQCPQCPKKFICASGLYSHMMVHTKEKPFVCDICGAAFHMAHLLRTHNLYHNGIKNYPCEHCDMRFVTAERQRRHMRTHTGEKPYRCKYCDKAFAQSNDYIKHLKQHLGENVYQCELCPLRFPMDRDLRAHFATHNNEDEETRVRNLEAREEEQRKLQIKLGVAEKK